MILIVSPYADGWPRAARRLGGSWVERKDHWYFPQMSKGPAVNLAMDLHQGRATINEVNSIAPDHKQVDDPPPNYQRTSRLFTKVYVADPYGDVMLEALRHLIGASFSRETKHWFIPRSREEDARALSLDVLGHDRIQTQEPVPRPEDAKGPELSEDEMDSLARGCRRYAPSLVRKEVRRYYISTRYVPRVPTGVVKEVQARVKDLQLGRYGRRQP